MNFKMFALTAGMAIAASTMAGATAKAPASTSNQLLLQGSTASGVLIAREKEPGDDRGRDRRHDDKGKDGKNHKAFQTVAREKEPGDDRGKHRRHDDKGKDERTTRPSRPLLGNESPATIAARIAGMTTRARMARATSS